MRELCSGLFGVAQGIGYALSEELIVKEGRTQNPSLGNYVIPMTAERVLKG